LALVASVAVAASVAFLAGRQDAPPPTIPLVQYQQKSYRDQAIFSARFMPDEKTIVMSSALDGNQVELFVIRPEYPEPQSLGLKGVHLLAVSSKGELAVLNNASYTGHHRLFLGTLARMPLEGAAPREVMEDVRDADWSPDGEALAIIHDVGEEDRLEYPVGRVLQKSAGYLSEVRVSPDGRFIAFMEHPSKFDDRGSVKIVDLAGTVRTLAGGYWGMEGMAWAPNSEAVFYSAGVDGNTFRVFRADLEGGVRSVSQSAGSVIIHDVAADGSWAVTIDDQPSSILFRAAGASRDVDCSWLANSIGPILSADGKTVLFTDQSSTGGPNYMVTLRPTSGGPILGLGEGDAEAFAPDGKSVLAAVPSTPPRLMVYPVGAGQAVQIDQGNFENISNADWMPDGKRVLVSANLAGQPPRCFLLDPDTGTVEPMGPEGIREGFPSSDGKEFVARSQSGWSIYPMEADAEGRPVPSTSSKDYVIRWDPDGSALFFYQRAQIPGRVDRVEIESGRRETVLTLGEEHIAGRVSILGVSMADDLRSVAYATWDYRSVLYTVERTR
jgi:Tol biopolymer transport system component